MEAGNGEKVRKFIGAHGEDADSSGEREMDAVSDGSSTVAGNGNLDGRNIKRFIGAPGRDAASSGERDMDAVSDGSSTEAGNGEKGDVLDENWVVLCGKLI
jgi:hypothetical protein